MNRYANQKRYTGVWTDMLIRNVIQAYEPICLTETLYRRMDRYANQKRYTGVWTDILIRNFMQAYALFCLPSLKLKLNRVNVNLL